MGLDLNPLGKPIPGKENEFAELFHEIKTASRGDKQQVLDQWFEIQTSPYETLGTPRIGIDDAATMWVLERFRKQEDPGETEDQHIKKYYGSYLPPLTPVCDGIPVYSNSAINAAAIHSFRGQFIVDDCADIVGEEIIGRLYTSALAKDLLELGEDLYRIARRYSSDNDVEFVETIRTSDAEEKTPELNAHILFAAARWCEYWGSRGHGFEADY